MVRPRPPGCARPPSGAQPFRSRRHSTSINGSRTPPIPPHARLHGPSDQTTLVERQARSPHADALAARPHRREGDDRAGLPQEGRHREGARASQRADHLHPRGRAAVLARRERGPGAGRRARGRDGGRGAADSRRTASPGGGARGHAGPRRVHAAPRGLAERIGRVHSRSRSSMELGLTNRVALVCGASRGIGYAVAAELAREGAQLGDLRARRGGGRRGGRSASRRTARDVLPVVADLQHGRGHRLDGRRRPSSGSAVWTCSSPTRAARAPGPALSHDWAGWTRSGGAAAPECRGADARARAAACSCGSGAASSGSRRSR